MIRKLAGFSIVFITLSIPAMLSSAQTLSKPADDNTAAIEAVISGFVDDFNRHDAHATAMWLSDDADFTNAQQSTSHGRKTIEEHLVPVFAGRLKKAHRTVIIRNIRFLTPEVATIAMDYELSGTLDPQGVELPLRKGLYHWIVTKHNGKWLIDVMEESELVKSPSGPSS